MDSDPNKFAALFSIVEDEVASNVHASSTSCTKGLLWLKRYAELAFGVHSILCVCLFTKDCSLTHRAMEFTVRILQMLMDNQSATLSAIITEAYTETLYKFHGYIVSGVFTVCDNLHSSATSTWFDRPVACRWHSSLFPQESRF
jgi:hypothetical protein